LVTEMFPGRPLVAFREEGELARRPARVEHEDEDQFLAPRRGGAWYEPCQRWRLDVQGAEEAAELVLQDLVDGLLVGAELPLSPELEESLAVLGGMGDASVTPVRRFQPLGIVEVLQHCEALIAVHLDKHGPAIAVYTLQPLDRSDVVRACAEDVQALAVPFAIPPMLARWDRALQELRVRWMAEREDEFPVPPADEPTRWSRLGRKRAQGDEE
jgi:hypothetical protein